MRRLAQCAMLCVQLVLSLRALQYSDVILAPGIRPLCPVPQPYARCQTTMLRHDWSRSRHSSRVHRKQERERESERENTESLFLSC